MNISISVIGGGSKLWALTLFKDLARAEGLSGSIRLYDIDAKAAEKNQKLAAAIFGHDKAMSVFKVECSDSPAKALEGSDIVVFTIEPGPIELRYADLVIPEQYGILQTVGDTTGPGGIIRAARAIPTIRDYAKQIIKYCPDAWVINYTNPMTLCTAAFYKEEPKIKAFGCCHEVFGTQHFLAEKTAEWYGVEKPKRDEIKLDICGLNHFTFATTAHWNGNDLYPELLKLTADEKTFADLTETAKQRTKDEKWFDSDKIIALDFLRNFGILGAAGDRHLAEFIPWYLTSDENIHRYGIMRTPYEWRVRNDRDKKNKAFKDDELVPEQSDEEGVDIMKALITGESLITNVNIPNIGQIPWLPEGHIVETNAVFGRGSVKPIIAMEPPKAVKAIVSRIASIQEMVLDAVFAGDDDLLFQAFLSDPLMNIGVPQAGELFNKMREYIAKN